MTSPPANDHGARENNGPAWTPTSEFICSGCGGPLEVTPASDVCLMEAWRLCPNCERVDQARREPAPWDVASDSSRR